MRHARRLRGDPPIFIHSDNLIVGTARIPCDDTYRRGSPALDLDEFQSYLVNWLKFQVRGSDGNLVTVDGGKLRCSLCQERASITRSIRVGTGPV